MGVTNLGVLLLCTRVHLLRKLRATEQIKQDCFLQKEARVCVSDAFVMEDSKFKWCEYSGWVERHLSWGYCCVKWLRKQYYENNKRFFNWVINRLCSQRWYCYHERIASLDGVFCCERWASDRGSRYAYVNIVFWVERQLIITWGYCCVKLLRKQYCENKKRLINCIESSIGSALSMLAELFLYVVFG